MSLALGIPVAEAKARISSKEFVDWMAYYIIEPFGEERADMRAAIVCQTIANCLGRGPDDKPFEIEDFMLDFSGEDSKLPTPEELLEKVKFSMGVVQELNAARQQRG